MVSGSADAQFMARALFLAERGRGRTSPNPLVGAVVVSPDGVVVGQGAHLRLGGQHAEIAALDMAGDAARGGTLYCTLEPCCHTGRTGPCVERIVPAGIARVSAAMQDPNPQVSGGGFAYLREHGVRVDVGAGERAARRLNAPFLTWLAHKRPFVIVKAAVSQDGFVAPEGGRAFLTSPAADRFFHRQRADLDAIAVGAGTVRTDDPLLTSRHVYRERSLIRVIFDWQLRVPPTARVFSTTADGPVIMTVSRARAAAAPEAVLALERAGAEIQAFDERAVGPVLEWLATRNVTSLLVEGGPALHQAFFDASAVDRIQRIDTRVALGSGRPAADGFRLDEIDGREAAARTVPLGADRLLEWDVHRAD